MANLLAASASSSMASASASPFDVFINHRGPDVKNAFASHLYRRLLDHGLRAFLDRDEMRKGCEISSQIEQAIGGAYVHIAIFSPRYAQSVWCLDELVLMKNSLGLENRRVTIFPIFYKIDPSVVRYQKEAYFEALRDLEQKKTKDSETGEEKPRYGFKTVQSWRDALSFVANLNGFTLGPEDDEVVLLDSLVEEVRKKVPRTPLDVAKYPTGLDLKFEEFEKIVERERVKPKVIGIVGVGGVGKTTLAKFFFNKKRSFFRESSFLSDVREVAGRMSVNDLQSKLIKHLKHKDIMIDRHEGIEILKRHLSSCEALIILDDVDHVSQLEAFLPITDVISASSLILVTSRDKHVLLSSGVLESSIYNLEGLDIPQSKELFCSYAFSQPLPPPEAADLVDEFVTACKGLPLSLKVIGALLCGINDRCYWQDQLERLNHTLPEEIFKTLRISYESLPKQDKPIFLDIACFFIGEDIDMGIRIWGMAGLRNIQNKCLLEVDTENKIKMHDHIRDMGRSIAEEPTMPRRLWDSSTNIIDNLSVQQSTVTTEVRAIMVSSSYDEFRYSQMVSFRNRRGSQILPTKYIMNNFHFPASHISPSKYLFNNSHFPAMRNLQFLVTKEDQLDDMLSTVQPQHLIWLRWYRISHSSLPNWIPMKNLKVLEVEGVRLNMLWPHQSQGVPFDLRELIIRAPLSEIPKSIGQLKYLERIAIYRPKTNAIYSPTPVGVLERLPDEFCRLGSLKYLVLESFSYMVSLPDSFGDLTNLQHIDLGDASSLQTLPDSFGKLTRLKHLSLEYASSLQTLPDSFGKLIRLKHLSLRGCKSLTISSGTLGDITTLELLDLSYCEHVNELPPQVADQLSLQELYLSRMKLKELPSVACNLKVLKLGGDLLEMLPSGLGDLKSLKSLSLSASLQLKSLPDSVGLLTQLTELSIWRCGIEYLPASLLQMNMLESLEVKHCPVQEHPFKKEVEGERETEGETGSNILNSSNRRCMFGLKSLDLFHTEIREVYFDEGVCPNLQQLTIEHCSELRQIGGLCGLPKLRGLHISVCAKVDQLSGLEKSTSLEWLKVWGCKKLQSIPGLGQLTKLRQLDVNYCPGIQELAGVEHLTSLEELSVSALKKRQSIPGLGQLTTLRELNVNRCREIQALPDVGHLTCLESLNVSQCEKLQSIPGLGQLTNLRELEVMNCHGIQELPGVEHLTSLESLILSGLQSLNCIQGLGQLTKLRYLYVDNCHERPDLPGVEHLISLQSLSIYRLGKLETIKGLGQLTKLRELNVGKCCELLELPGVEYLMSLEIVDVCECPKLLWRKGILEHLRQQLKNFIYE